MERKSDGGQSRWIWCVHDEGVTVLNTDWVIAATIKRQDHPAQDVLTLTIAAPCGGEPGVILLRGAEARRVWGVIRGFVPESRECNGREAA